MCGRFTLTVPTFEILANSLGIPALPGDSHAYRPRYNVAPTDTTWVVREHGGARRLEAMVWGLVPRFSKRIDNARRPINARAESIEEKPSFRDSFLQRRCVVVADGFLEWDKREEQKIPTWFVPKSGELLLMGGLYDEWISPEDGQRLRTFTVVTTEPNREVLPIHDRMPLMLSRADLPTWLHTPQAGEPLRATDELRSLLRAAPDNSFDLRQVSRRVGSTRNDDPSVLLPWASDEEAVAQKKPTQKKAAAKPAAASQNLLLFGEAVAGPKGRRAR